MRLRSVIEEAGEALAAQIGQAGAANVLALILEQRRTRARKERPTPRPHRFHRKTS